ncbi:MAG TPA: hypothetical protein VK324_13580 [Tepidisphaeraceae bacterium]|nr:hypothetical protein [Tepidisphaeraceae bacterium]
MPRFVILALLGLFAVSGAALTGCDDDDIKLDTPGGDVKIDR